MKWYYLSHPYTGDEEKNKEEAAEIHRKLQELHPDVLFLNPLAAFDPLADMPYEQVMEYSIEMLIACDAVVMSGNYKESRGCMAELKAAQEQGMLVRYCTSAGELSILPEFRQSHVVSGTWEEYGKGGK